MDRKVRRQQLAGFPEQQVGAGRRPRGLGRNTLGYAGDNGLRVGEVYAATETVVEDARTVMVYTDRIRYAELPAPLRAWVEAHLVLPGLRKHAHP